LLHILYPVVMPVK